MCVCNIYIHIYILFSDSFCLLKSAFPFVPEASALTRILTTHPAALHLPYIPTWAPVGSTRHQGESVKPGVDATALGPGYLGLCYHSVTFKLKLLKLCELQPSHLYNSTVVGFLENLNELLHVKCLE